MRMMKKSFQQGRSKRGPEEVHTKLRLNRSLSIKCERIRSLPPVKSYVDGLP
jgi:hypothetical protein